MSENFVYVGDTQTGYQVFEYLHHNEDTNTIQYTVSIRIFPFYETRKD